MDYFPSVYDNTEDSSQTWDISLAFERNNNRLMTAQNMNNNQSSSLQFPFLSSSNVENSDEQDGYFGSMFEESNKRNNLQPACGDISQTEQAACARTQNNNKAGDQNIQLSSMIEEFKSFEDLFKRNDRRGSTNTNNNFPGVRARNKDRQLQSISNNNPPKNYCTTRNNDRGIDSQFCAKQTKASIIPGKKNNNLAETNPIVEIDQEEEVFLNNYPDEAIIKQNHARENLPFGNKRRLGYDENLINNESEINMNPPMITKPQEKAGASQVLPKSKTKPPATNKNLNPLTDAVTISHNNQKKIEIGGDKQLDNEKFLMRYSNDYHHLQALYNEKKEKLKIIQNLLRLHEKLFPLTEEFKKNFPQLLEKYLENYVRYLENFQQILAVDNKTIDETLTSYENKIGHLKSKFNFILQDG